jgi:hypothetical protein
MRCDQDPYWTADHRAWAEPGSSPLRVQIRRTTDVSLGVQRSETTADADAVVEVVRAWLLEMAATAL